MKNHSIIKDILNNLILIFLIAFIFIFVFFILAIIYPSYNKEKKGIIYQKIQKINYVKYQINENIYYKKILSKFIVKNLEINKNIYLFLNNKMSQEKLKNKIFKKISPLLTYCPEISQIIIFSPKKLFLVINKYKTNLFNNEKLKLKLTKLISKNKNKIDNIFILKNKNKFFYSIISKFDIKKNHKIFLILNVKIESFNKYLNFYTNKIDKLTIVYRNKKNFIDLTKNKTIDIKYPKFNNYFITNNQLIILKQLPIIDTFIYYQSPTAKLFYQPNKKLLVEIILLFVIFIIFIIILIIYIKPLSNKIILSYDELKEQVKKESDKTKEIEKTHKLILNSAGEGIFGLDQNAKITFVNGAAKVLLKYNEADLIGKDHHNIIHHTKEDGSPYPKKECPIFETLKTGKIFVYKRDIFWTKDNTPLYVAFTSAPIQKNNKILGAVITFQDITKNLKREEEIKKLSTIIEQTFIGIVITDKNGIIQYVNPAYQKVTGYSEKELIGENPRVLKSGMHPKSFYKNLWDTILSGRLWEGEFINKRKDGSLYHEEANIFPIKNQKGEIINFVAIKKDITETKALREQLQQAQKLEAIGTLAGGIAHDFNNILTVIAGYTEMGLKTIDINSTAYKYLENIKTAIKRASSLVNQLLAFSRKQPFNPKPINLVSELKSLEKILKRLLPEDIKLIFEYKAKDIIIFADPTQIEQILINLVINARDAIYEKTSTTIKQIEIIVDKIEFKTNLHTFNLKLGNYAKITVKDTGKGIPQNIINKIFEPFFTTKKKGQGTGLGLSTVYGIIKQNKGEIKVFSEKDKGTTFEIYLPCYESDKIFANIKEFKQEDIMQNLPVGNEKILVVEDDENVRKVITSMLESLGYTIFEAENGLKALELLHQHNYNFDLIISDIVMPEMDGKMLYENVVKTRKDLKFLFISGYPVEFTDYKKQFIKKISYIQKPIDAKTLAKKTRELLDEEKNEK